MPQPLSPKERLILDIVRDQGDPHTLEVLEHYHRRSGVPLEAVTVAKLLQNLVRKGSLRFERRPAPKEAPFEQMVHFIASEVPAGRP